MRSRSWLLSTVLVAMAVAGPARADVIPDGKKPVEYTFVVTGLSASPDRVFFAFPCGTSNGTPYMEHAKLEEGVPVPVGRRGGDCTIYSIEKAQYEAWAKTYKPTNQIRDPALEALAAKALKCEGKPTLIFFVPREDPRTAIQETLELKTSTATSCELVSKNAPANDVAAKAGTAPAVASGGEGDVGAGGAADAGRQAPAASGNEVKKKSGCTAAPGADRSSGLAVAAVALAALVGRRGRRRSTTEARLPTT